MRTSELTGRALAYAVGMAEGCRVETWHTKSVAILSPGVPRAVPWNPHTDWSQGGPIIERERIELGSYADQWQANAHLEGGSIFQRGPTSLVAAMRCYVASKLGDEVEVPEELVCPTK